MLLPRYYFSGDFTQFEEKIIEHGAHMVRFEPGEYLSPPLEVMHTCFYIQSGLALFSILNDEGKEDSIMFFGPGSINPCVCGVYAFTLEKYILLKAITPITAFAYAPEITQKMIEEDSSYAAAIIKHYCTMTNLVMVRGMFSKSLDSLYKVSNFLYLFSLRNPYYGMNGSWSCEKIELSQEEIASFVGISRIQVARSLAQLREEKIIRTFRGKVQIIDKEKLKGYCASIIDEEL